MFQLFKTLFYKPSPRFQVTIQIPSGHIIFRTANSQEDVDEWVKAFEESSALNLRVYEYDPRGAYELKIEKGSEIHETTRPIGFCR